MENTHLMIICSKEKHLGESDLLIAVETSSVCQTLHYTCSMIKRFSDSDKKKKPGVHN
jgi:hypothetical protein